MLHESYFTADEPLLKQFDGTYHFLLHEANVGNYFVRYTFLIPHVINT